MIVKIGGCNGSGKTSLMRGLMDIWNFVPVPVDPAKIGGKVARYEALIKEPELMAHLFTKVVVLGDYRNVCGGMDTISDKEVRYAMVESWVKDKKALVLFEGLITGKTYGALGSLSEASAVPWLYTYMDTPFDVCVERVLARRKAAGNTAPFDPERTMRPTFKSCQSTAARAKQLGHPVFMVNHKLNPTKAAKELLKAVSNVMAGGRPK